MEDEKKTAALASPEEQTSSASAGHSPGSLRSRVAEGPSPPRAWLYLVWLSMQRQARARQMVGIALGLLVLTATIIVLNTAANRWSMRHYRWTWINPEYRKWEEKYRRREIKHLPPDVVPNIRQTHNEATGNFALAAHAIPWGGLSGAGPELAGAVYGAALAHSGLYVFSRWIVYSVFVGFLLPIWSLSFATEALGGERESRSLVWLLSRPLSRPAIYTAKFAALLPWTLGLNLGGFGLLCLAAGAPGRQAFALYWPAVALASLAFCALFHLMSAIFRRPAVVAICYTFFLETILSTMPGYMKRISVGFYTRCLMFDSAESMGLLPPEKPSIYLPVDGATAATVLLGMTAGLLVLGMIVFARSEYWEDL